jgi:hypothetical protein
MRSNLRRRAPYAVALSVVAGLTAVAGALGLVGQLIVHAPADVWAGFPILGQITGAEDITHISALQSACGNVPVLPPLGMGEPIYFTVPTLEPWAPGSITVTASDFDETNSATVILK